MKTLLKDWKLLRFSHTALNYFISLFVAIFLLDIGLIQESEIKLKDLYTSFLGKSVESNPSLIVLNVGERSDISSSSDVGQTSIALGPDYKSDAYIEYTASIVQAILDKQPRGIILNLDENHGFFNKIEKDNHLLSSVLFKNRDKIVWSTAPYVEPFTENYYLPSYNNLFVLGRNWDPEDVFPKPSNENGSAASINEYHGFFEIFDRSRKLLDRINPNRHNEYCPLRSFKRDDFRESEEKQQFYSVVYLAYKKFLIGDRPIDDYEKWCNHKNIDLLIQTTIPESIPNESNIFMDLDVQSLCGIQVPLEELPFIKNIKEACKTKNETSSDKIAKIKNSIVIINFLPQGAVHPALNYFKNQPEAAKTQALLLHTLKTQSLYYITGPASNIFISFLLVFLVSGLIYFSFKGTSGTTQYIFKCIQVTSIISIIYFFATIALISLNIILPITFPIVVGYISGVLIPAIVLAWKERNQRLIQVAVTKNLQKWSTRIASDIHDGPLQELKVVMDSLEALDAAPQLSTSRIKTLDSEALVDKVAKVGNDIRSSLDNLNSALNLSHHLNSGLIAGIEKYLQEQSEEIQLEISIDTQDFQEPEVSAEWIEAREDIFRFFREALSNVIRHGQPPRGNSTHLLISLKSEDKTWTLRIDNNIKKKENRDRCHSVLTSNHVDCVQKEPRTGTGTKLMETIAQSLPGGGWSRIFHSDGSVSTTLSWSLEE